MRRIIFLFIFIAFLSCNTSKKEESKSSKEQAKITNFDWLLGNWQRRNDAEGVQTFEQWKSVNDTVYIGFGFTLHGIDTIFQESIELIKRENGWNLEVVPQGDTIATVFGITHIDKNRFLAENKFNDFPKIIEYKRKDHQLIAIISNDEKRVDFVFEQKNKSN